MSGSSGKSPSECDETNLIINYLPQTVDEQDLYNMFIECGQIEDYKIIRDRTSRISRGFGFVKYMEKTSAEKAITKYDGFKMGRKTIRVSISRPTGEDTKEANLVLENLPTTMSEDTLKEQFSVYGKIITHRIVRDKNNASTGKAYIRFNKKQEAQDAILGLNGVDIGSGLPLIVRFADPPVVRATPELIKSQRIPHPRGQPYQRVSEAHYQGYHTPKTRPHPQDHVIRLTSPSQIPKEHYSSYDEDRGWVLFVYNIPEYSTRETLYGLFSRYGAINSVRPYTDRGNRCKGFGFVHMINYNEACSAIHALNGSSYDGKILQVRFKDA